MLQSQWSVSLSPRYIFNKPVDGHALAIFGVKLGSRRIAIQSSLQRVEVTNSDPSPASFPRNPPSLPHETTSSPLSCPESRSLEARVTCPSRRTR